MGVCVSCRRRERKAPEKHWVPGAGAKGLLSLRVHLRAMANAISNIKMTNPLKGIVSKRRKRYVKDGFNLDLAYITDRIIAMGFPADKLEGVYRNHIDEVWRFLEQKHKGHYMIYNLCAERKYDTHKFHDRVKKYAFEDHAPPKIDQIQPFCESVHTWLNEDSRNVAAVHCKAGKGRTGTMVCCYLLYSGQKTTADEALKFYGTKRTHDEKGVTIPSQRRYVEYFAALVHGGLAYRATRVHVRELRMSPPPALNGSQCTLELVVSQVDPPFKASLGSHELRRHETVARVALQACTPLQGDVRVDVYCKQKMMRKERLFHFWFNTFFVTACVGASPVPAPCDSPNLETFKLTLDKWQLDDAHKDKQHKHYSADFKVEVIIQKQPESSTFSTQSPRAPSTPSSASTCSENDEHWDSGEILYCDTRVNSPLDNDPVLYTCESCKRDCYDVTTPLDNDAGLSSVVPQVEQSENVYSVKPPFYSNDLGNDVVPKCLHSISSVTSPLVDKDVPTNSSVSPPLSPLYPHVPCTRNKRIPHLNSPIGDDSINAGVTPALPSQSGNIKPPLYINVPCKYDQTLNLKPTLPNENVSTATTPLYKSLETYDVHLSNVTPALAKLSTDTLLSSKSPPLYYMPNTQDNIKPNVKPPLTEPLYQYIPTKKELFSTIAPIIANESILSSVAQPLCKDKSEKSCPYKDLSGEGTLTSGPSPIYFSPFTNILCKKLHALCHPQYTGDKLYEDKKDQNSTNNSLSKKSKDSETPYINMVCGKQLYNKQYMEELRQQNSEVKKENTPLEENKNVEENKLKHDNIDPYHETLKDVSSKGKNVINSNLTSECPVYSKIHPESSYPVDTDPDNIDIITMDNSDTENTQKTDSNKKNKKPRLSLGDVRASWREFSGKFGDSKKKKHKDDC